jgi:class 3 adenylate cyclase
LFADLVGFTSLSERLDIEDVQAVLDPYYACLRDEIKAFGGEVEKYVGDAVVGVWGAPVAHGDDPERAVRAAIGIRDSLARLNAQHPGLDLQVRIAVNTGEAMVALGARLWAGEAMMAGDSVNTAARLQTSAPTNTVLVGEETYRATKLMIDYRPVDPITVKGKQAPVPAWIALSAGLIPGERAAKGASLVGRRQELAALDDRLDHVFAQRHTHVVSVFGLPGVGKSRLAAEFAASVAGRGGRTIRGRSLPYGDSGAYGAFAQQIKQVSQILDSDSAEVALDKLQRAAGSLLGPEDGDQLARQLAVLLDVGDEAVRVDRPTLFLAVRRFVEALASQQPTVLLFEDLQWATPSLVDLLEFLASRIRDAPVLLLTLARPDFLTERPSWGAGLPAYMALPLDPLGVEESRELARRLLARPASDGLDDMAERLAATGEGNPLFIEELVASLAEQTSVSARQSLELPTSVRGIVASRLDALPTDERAALLDASIAGRIFWKSVLDRLGEHGGGLGEILDRLEWRDLIRREPVSRISGQEQFRFKHMVIREVAYATLPRSSRRVGHAVVAHFLEEAGVARDSLAVLAHHWREADDQEKAIDYFVAAADQARRGWAKDEAVRYYKEALRLIPESDMARRRHVRLQCAVAEQMALHVQDAEWLGRGQLDADRSSTRPTATG